MYYKEKIRNLTLEEAKFFMSMADCEQITLRDDKLLLYKTKCLDNKGKEILRSFFWNNKRCWINYFSPEFSKPVKKVFGCSAEANFLLMKYMFDQQETKEFKDFATRNYNGCGCIINTIRTQDPALDTFLNENFDESCRKAAILSATKNFLNTLRS